MTAAPRVPWAPQLPVTHLRPLADVARPARGRITALSVLTTVVEGPDRVVVAGQRLTHVLEAVTGLTRCSLVVVRYTADDDQVLTLLSMPSVTAVVAPSELDKTLTAYLDAGPRAVLLLAACSVLWRQTSGVRCWS